MATFNARSLEKKLKILDGTQTGIQTLSLWIIHHRQHSQQISSTWIEYLKKVQKPEKRLGLFYLANDVVQNGRKKAKDLVVAFGDVLQRAAVLLSDEKIKAQVDRVFDIWLERSVYDAELIKLCKEKLLGTDVKKEIKEEKPEVKTKSAYPLQKKLVPPDFKVSDLLISMKRNTSSEHDIDRKSKLLDGRKIDASSYDSIKHIKDRSSVDRFFKQFEESKVLLDDFIHALRKSEKEKKTLIALLSGGEAFYQLAQEEAKVIVNAYKTFGTRLNTMKKKLDSKIRKLENGSNSKNFDVSSPAENIREQDMDIDSDSDTDIPSSQQYNINTAPPHSPTTPIISENEDETVKAAVSKPPSSFDSLDSFNSDRLSGMASFLNQSESGMQSFGEMNTLHSCKSSETAAAVVTSISGLQSVSLAPISQTSSTLSLAQPLPMAIHSVSSGSTSTFSFNQVRSKQSPKNSIFSNQSEQTANSKNEQSQPFQNLIDSLFPVLSKSLQTIKEKQQAGDDNKPSINDAIAFALGDNQQEDIPRKKHRYSRSASTEAISPVSLTNPQGLSENQTELINIAAGLTKFDENYLPLKEQKGTHLPKSEQSLIMSQGGVTEEDTDLQESRMEGQEKKKSRHSTSRHRAHRDDDRHRRSLSRSPSRKSSHRSRDRSSRDDRHHERRRSRRSPSPRRRKSRGGERDEKRRSPPDEKTKPYYNDRRSPTPELDSSAAGPSATTGSFQPQIAQTPGVNQMLSNQPFQSFSAGSTVQTTAQSTMENAEIRNNKEKSVIPDQQNVMSGSEQSMNNLLHFGNPMLPMHFNNLPMGLRPIDPSILPPMAVDPSTLRPLIAPFPDQLQMVPPQIRGDNQHRLLHLRPIGPGIVSFNPPNNQLVDNMQQMNVISQQTSSSQDNSQVTQSEVLSKQGISSLHALSQQQQGEGDKNLPMSLANRQPHPGPPPRPPTFSYPRIVDGLGRPTMGHFRAKRAEPDPLLEQMEIQSASPHFKRPQFERPMLERHPFENLPFERPTFDQFNTSRVPRPRFDGHHLPPRFNHGPRFDAYRGALM